MKRFDMHIHCGDQPVDPEKLLAQMDACGIYGSIDYISDAFALLGKNHPVR